MSTPHIGGRILLLLPWLLLLGCGSEGNSPFGLNDTCMQVDGHGETEGHVRSLAGSGVFHFDGVERPAKVGVYLNNLRTLDGDFDNLGEDRKRVDIVYQFWWENGDMLLTEDDVILWPLLEDGDYEFSTSLLVKSGQGMFAGMEGRRILKFSAVLEFGPIIPEQGLGAVSEHFQIGGTLCVDPTAAG